MSNLLAGQFDFSLVEFRSQSLASPGLATGFRQVGAVGPTCQKSKEMTVKNSIEVDLSTNSVTVVDLVVINPDLIAVLSPQPASAHRQAMIDIIAVGSAAMRRVQTTVDLDLIEKRFGGLSVMFERSLTAFEQKALDTLTKRFSPTENGSYTKHLADVVSIARKDVQSWTNDLSKCAKDLLDPEKKE